MKVAKSYIDLTSPTGEDQKKFNQSKFNKKVSKSVKIDKEVEALSLRLAKLKAKGQHLDSNLVGKMGTTSRRSNKKKRSIVTYKANSGYVPNGGAESTFKLPSKVWAQQIIAQPFNGKHSIDSSDTLIDQFDVDGGAYDHFESIVLLCVSLYDSKTYLGMMSAFLAYCKHYHIKKPLVTSLQKLLTQTYSQYSTQSGFVDNVCNFIDNWTDLVKLPIFNYVGRIIAICVSLGLCSASRLKFGFEGITLFANEALKKQATAVDLLDAIMQTVRYFLAAGAEAFKTGSLRPFLFPNQRVAALDTLYNQVKCAMTLFSSGNLIMSDIKTEPELANALLHLKDELNAIKSIEKDPILKRIIDGRITQVYVWHGEFVARSAGGQLRPAPYTFLIWGKSGFGKSAIATTLIQSILCANGFDHTDPSKVVTINCADKYISNAKTSTLAYIFDDMGAEDPKKQDVNHARRWLDMSNNIAGYANMADVVDKGMCTFNHKVQVGTSNHKNGGMDIFSTYPIAVARRGTRDKVDLLPKFMNIEGSVDSMKVSQAFPPKPNHYVIPDIYKFTVEKATENLINPGTYRWNVVDWDNNGTVINMKDVDYKTYISYHVHQSKLHFAYEDSWVQTSKVGPASMQICKKHGCINSLCGCGYVTQFGLEEAVLSVANRALNRYATEVYDFGSECIQHLRNRNLINLIPNFVFNSPLFQQYVEWHITNISGKYTWILAFILWVIGFTFSWNSSLAIWFVWLTSLCGMCFGKLVVDRIVNHAFFTLVEHDRHAMQARLLILQRRFMMCVAYGAGIIMFVKMYQLYKSTPKFRLQGNLSPQNIDDIYQRDDEQNMWASVVNTPLIASEKSQRMPFEHLQNVVRKNQLYVSCEDGGRRPCSNAFMIKTGYCIIPYHMLYDDARTYIFQRNDISIVGSSFKAVLAKSDAQLLADSDLALVYIPSCGDFKDLTEYLALTTPRSAWASLVFKRKDGSFTDPTGFKIKPEKVVCNELAFPSINALGYVLPYTTFNGLCCGTLITLGKSPTICGFHSVGYPDERKGASSTITLAKFKTAAELLNSRFVSIIPLADQGDIPSVQHGIEYFEGDNVHKKSPCRFMSAEQITSCNVYGSVIGRNKMNSNIHSTSVADKVREVFKNPLKYGPPKFYLGKHWREHLVKCFSPSHGCSQSLLNRAVQDYMLIIPKLLRVDSFKSQITPLSNNAIINGIDGVRFIDRMKTNSSMGFPINKSKSHFLNMCDGPNEVNYDLPPHIWDAVAEAEHNYANGKRNYPIFRACLKDEVKSLNSEKVRVFEAAPIVLQIIIRKYFLPIARVLSMYPLDSECAVGINAVSDEWQQLIDHVRKFGTSRIIAGDYSGFDTRMPAQFTIAAFKILIHIAKLCNYDEHSITIMQSLVADVVHPLVAFNGDLIMLFGTNPSGQNLTVYINSIVNSLYLRVTFFSLYPDLDFQDYVSVATYGDDFIGSVSPLCPKFTFRHIKSELGKMDIKLTLPDKNDSNVEYLHLDEADFLKRKSFFHPELGHEVGLLDEESILKSLVCQEVSSSVTRDEQLAGALASALNEYFYYGRDIYNDRKEKLNEVFKGFPLHIPELEYTYEYRLSKISPY